MIIERGMIETFWETKEGPNQTRLYKTPKGWVEWDVLEPKIKALGCVIGELYVEQRVEDIPEEVKREVEARLKAEHPDKEIVWGEETKH